jgi:hypothetical protein
VRVTVDLVQGDPFKAAALPQEERVYEPTEIVVNHFAARALADLPAGKDAAVGVVDLLTDRVLCVCREDEGELLATLDVANTARLAVEWAALVATDGRP